MLYSRFPVVIVLPLLLFCACAGTIRSTSQVADSWVGLIYEGGSLPGDAEYRGGSVIDSTRTYAVTEASLAGERFLLLDSLVAHTDAGKAVWMILDTQRLPEMSDSRSLLYGLSACNLRGEEPDPELIAIVAYEGKAFTDVEVFRDICAAWRASIETGRFEEVEPAEVECVNEMFGYDG